MLEVEGVAVRLGGTLILPGTSLTVGDGEVVAVLGPSGSGKTTLLRAIAGLVDLEGGDIRWDGSSLRHLAPHRRGFGLMFQGFALFPHLDVAGNVGYGLRMTGHPGDGRVAEVLAWVGLAGFEHRRIDDLSGGERQRVALARTLAPRPRLVMLDEPMGSLDRNLRERLVTETRDLLRRNGATAIVVTHDRDEAVQLSDRLAVMRDGRIVQTGDLDSILADPADPWVAEFLS